MKRLFTLGTFIFLLTIAGCSKQELENRGKIESSNINKKNVENGFELETFSGKFDFEYISETDAQSSIGEIKREAYSTQGKYFLRGSENSPEDYLFFVDKNSGREVLVCNKSNCKHENKDCNAFFDSEIYMGTSMWFQEGNLYIVANYEGEFCLEKISPDGVTRERVLDILKQQTETTTNEDGSQEVSYYYPEMQLHRGYLYYSDSYPGSDSTTLWKLSMNNKETAQPIFKIEGENVQIYRVYPFGRYVFFQAGCVGDAEGNLDISLYAYDIESEDLVYLIKDDVIREYTLKENYLYYEDLQDKIIQFNLETGQAETIFGRENCPEYTEEWNLDTIFFKEDKLVLNLCDNHTGEEMQIMLEDDKTYQVLKETEMVDCY